MPSNTETLADKWDGDDKPDFGMFGEWLFAPAEGGDHA